MRRLKVVLREEAVADLAEIYNHIARISGSRVTAIGFVRRIKVRCQRIGNVSDGRHCPR
jgi:toxin ParE1/3/4